MTREYEHLSDEQTRRIYEIFAGRKEFPYEGFNLEKLCNSCQQVSVWCCRIVETATDQEPYDRYWHVCFSCGDTSSGIWRKASSNYNYISNDCDICEAEKNQQHL